MSSISVRFVLLLVFLAFITGPTAIVSAEEKLPPLPAATQIAPQPPELWTELPPLPPLEVEPDGKPHTIWTCSMHPNIQLPEFGQCPICFMDLIEVTLDSGAKLTSLRQVSLNDNARKLAQVEVTPVVRGAQTSGIRMVGKIDYDETLVSTIAAWIDGRIDKLHVDYTGAQVRAGQPMAEIYSPELLAAQAELIEAVAAAAKSNAAGNPLLSQTINRTETAARKKLQLLGLTSEQINEIIARKKTTDQITLTAPISGIVIHKGVTEGMYVKTGAPIYTIADLSSLWVILEAYESDLHGIRMDQPVEFSAEALPGTLFTGRIAYIDPLIDQKTRTVKIRLNIDNPDFLLKPGMFVRAVVKSSPAAGNGELPLLIPASSPLPTGKRAIVYVQLPDKEGVYEGREIILGPRRGEFYEVVSGLQEGELVVNRGNFKLDSAIQIQARPSMMNPFTGKETTDPVELPPLFASKLNLLNETFARLSQAVHTGDQESRDRSLNSFSTILTGVQSDFLDPDIKLDWLELAMVLNSDIILLREAENNEEMRRIFAEMATHFYQLRTRFQLEQPILAREGSDELRRQLEKLLIPYFSLQKNLAADAQEESLADARRIAAGAQRFITELTSSGSTRGTALAAELNAAVQQLQTGTDIRALRSAFYPLSKSLINAVSTYGVSGSFAVYEHYCPMAFNDTGATWLDTSETISNPYFGEEMLRCGEVLNQFKLEE